MLQASQIISAILCIPFAMFWWIPFVPCFAFSNLRNVVGAPGRPSSCSTAGGSSRPAFGDCGRAHAASTCSNKGHNTVDGKRYDMIWFDMMIWYFFWDNKFGYAVFFGHEAWASHAFNFFLLQASRKSVLAKNDGSFCLHQSEAQLVCRTFRWPWALWGNGSCGKKQFSSCD